MIKGLIKKYLLRDYLEEERFLKRQFEQYSTIYDLQISGQCDCSKLSNLEYFSHAGWNFSTNEIFDINKENIGKLKYCPKCMRLYVLK